MRAHLLSAFPGPPTNRDNWAFIWLRESAEQDPFGRHTVTDDPAEADIILFVENHAHSEDPYLLGIRHHRIYRAFPNKCFLYHDDDVAVAVLRGIFPSIRRRDYLADRCRSAGYIARVAENNAIQFDPTPRARRWLYSFLGEANSTVRRRLFSRAHPEGLVRNTSGLRLWEMEPGATRELFTSQYAEAILESQFVLCPGGFGPSTFRLFEVMAMGRVPVILSDEWVPPPGPRWDEFSIWLPEVLVGEIPLILSQVSEQHEEMGRKARIAWEQWFAKPVCFHRMIELCADIQATPLRRWSAARGWATMLRPPHLKNSLRPRYRSIIAKARSCKVPLLRRAK
jgi:hypothetical protein